MTETNEAAGDLDGISGVVTAAERRLQLPQRVARQRFGFSQPAEGAIDFGEHVPGDDRMRMRFVLRLLEDLDGPEQQFFGPRRVAIGEQDSREVIEGDGHVRIVRPEVFFFCGERLAKERTRLGVAALAGVERSEIVPALGEKLVAIWYAPGQVEPGEVQALRVVDAAGGGVRGSQVVRDGGGHRAVRDLLLSLEGGEGLLVERDRVADSAGELVRESKLV